MIGVDIIEKNVQMTSWHNRSLIHCLLVNPDICNQHIGTTMLKMVMSHRDYVDCKIMAVTSLSKEYNAVVGFECFRAFFDKFKFQVMKKQKKRKKEITMLIQLSSRKVKCYILNRLIFLVRLVNF